MKSSIFIVLSFFLVTSIYSNPSDTKLIGKIINKETNKPISFVNIYLVDSWHGTISNSEGYFELVLPEKHKNNKVVFSCIGFKSDTLGLSKTNTLKHQTIKLQAN